MGQKNGIRFHRNLIMCNRKFRAAQFSTQTKHTLQWIVEGYGLECIATLDVYVAQKMSLPNNDCNRFIFYNLIETRKTLLETHP